MAKYHSVKPERTTQDVLTNAQNKCDHTVLENGHQTVKLIVTPIWTTCGTLDIKTIHCQECDAFLGYVTRKHPIIPQVDTSSTLRIHQLTNLKFPIRFNRENYRKLN